MKKVIVIVGPTAVGKTKLSIELAKAYQGEIINADSTQVYRSMDIATAKIKEKEKEGIPHHLFDIKDPKEDYTVYDYQKDCRKKIEEIFKRGNTPILVGGTGLYIKAALYNYQFEEEEKNEEDSRDTQTLYQELLNKDPKTTIHPKNRKRILRALQYYNFHQKPFSEKKKADTLLYDTIFLGLTTDRTILYEKINRRVDAMIEEGLLEEAKKMYELPYRSKAILTPIGYKELFPYFEVNQSLEECISTMKKNSRHYAKRQYTFFRHQLPIVWFPVNYNHFDQTVEDVKNYIEEK